MAANLADTEDRSLRHLVIASPISLATEKNGV